MKAGIDKILQRTQAEYLDSLTPPRDALLARIEQYAAEHNHPIADPEVAQIERILVRALVSGTDPFVPADARACNRRVPLRVPRERWL